MSEQPALCNIRLLLEYDGAAFHGFQRQSALRTVQGELEAALAEVFKQPVKLTGAGRTDAGVHAVGQVANFRARTRMPVERIPTALNRLLPVELVVKGAGRVDWDFDARRSARGRRYRYTVLNREYPSALLARYCWWVGGRLDLEQMRQSAKLLIGRHDFKSFQAAGSEVKNSVRTLSELNIISSGAFLFVVIEADAFLYQMARIIVGTLLQAARGRLTPEQVGEILKAADRSQAAPPAPARGLCLTRVRY